MLAGYQGALKSQEMARLVPGLANNVLVVLLTQLLLGIGYILAGIFSKGGITDAG